MNKTQLASLALGSFLLASCLSGCSEETFLGEADGNTGYITLDLDFNPSPLNGRSKSLSRADGAIRITAEDLTLTLTDKNRGNVTTHTVSDFAQSHTVQTGNYTLEATYGNKDEEGWNLPYYYGSQELTVKNQASTTVSLPVGLANAIIVIDCSDAFKEYMTDFKTEITTASRNIFPWTSDTDSELYVNPGWISFAVTFTKPNGKGGTAEIKPFEAKAQHRYTITLDADYQSQTINLEIDDTFEEQNVDIDISDANLPLLEPAPVVLTDDFTLGGTIEMVEHDAVSSHMATIAARGTIASAELNTTSAALSSKGFPASVNLCNPGPAAAKLSELGLSTKGLSGNRDVFGVIDFTKLLPNIPYVESGDNTTSFSLTVTDEQGKETTVDLFTVKIEQLKLSVIEGEISNDGNAYLKIFYNGNRVDNLVIECKNGLGQWKPVNIDSKTMSAESTYTLNLSSSYITLDYQLPIRVSVGTGNTPVDYTLTVPSMRIVDASTNTFANHAFATVLFTTDEAAQGANDVKFEVSTDGGATFTPATTTVETAARSSRASAGSKAVYKIAGLTPGTTYTYRSTLSGETSRTMSLTTENTEQLPNANLEIYSSTKPKSNCEFFTFEGWGTLNDLTMSQVSEGANDAYVSSSGTRPTTGHSGNGVLIRTVGWGSGTTAAGSISNIKHVDRGELFLGKWGSTIADNVLPEYGITFFSRPSSISFWHKFTAVNGNNGYMEIRVYDATGNEIAANSTTIEAQSNWTQTTLPLSYSSDCPPASRLSVIFRSTNKGKSINGTAMSKSDVKTVTISATAVHTGSELYIDDIVLNY